MTSRPTGHARRRSPSRPRPPWRGGRGQTAKARRPTGKQFETTPHRRHRRTRRRFSGVALV